MVQSLPIGLAQVFFSDKLVSVALVVLGIAISTPIGAVVGLLGCAMYLLAGWLVGAKPDELYTGLWGYNAALTATAIGGVFYTPNLLSISIGLICAFLASIASILLAPLFSLLKLPVLSVPFAIVTIHLHQAGNVLSEGELTYVFNCMDRDGSGAIDFEEFGELMLRHQRLMSRYTEFVTYFLPIDVDADDAISMQEMNTALASLKEPPLSDNEMRFLQEQTRRT